MKKTIFALLLISSAAIVFAFTFKKTQTAKLKILVTADKPAKFDFHAFGNGKTMTGVTTPFETTVDKIESHFIVRSVDPNAPVKIEVQEGGMERLTANWTIIVLVVDRGSLKTFGID